MTPEQSEVVQLGNMLAEAIGVQFASSSSTSSAVYSSTTSTLANATATTTTMASEIASTASAARSDGGGGGDLATPNDCRWPWQTAARREALSDADRARLATQLKQHHQQLLQVVAAATVDLILLVV